MIIIYLKDDNTIACLVPTPDALRTMTIEEIARKDVPTGKAYHVLNVSEVPNDRTYRNAWTYEES